MNNGHTLIDRPLPSSVEAERAVLGSIFLANDAFYQCDNLSAEDFTLEAHRKIYRAMVELVEDNRPIDFVTIGEKIGQGDGAYATGLTDGLPRVKNIGHHVDIILEKSQRRKFIQAAASALDSAYDGDITETITQTDERILEIGYSGKKSRPKAVREITPGLYTEIQRVQNLDPYKAAIAYGTGMPGLDKFIKGYHKGELCVIGGYTADGKSSLMKQGVLAQVTDGVKTVVFSGEMTDEQLLLTMLAPVAGIKYAHLRDSRLLDMYEGPKLASARPVVDSWPLWIDDASGLHIRDVCARARAYIRREGAEIVFLDHTGKYRADGERYDLQVANLARALAALAKTENVPVVALHQLSRGNDKKGFKRRPRLSDLRDSAVVEQEAHTVLFVYRPVDKEEEFTEFDEIVVAKQRHGEVGVVRARYDKETLMFEGR